MYNYLSSEKFQINDPSEYPGYPTYPTPSKLDHLKAIICPAAKLHDTGLLVEGEILDVHLTGAVVDGGRPPLHLPGAVEGRLGGQRHLEVAVSTDDKRVSDTKS